MENRPGYFRIAGLSQDKGIYPDLRAVGGGFPQGRSARILPADKPVRLRERDGRVDLRGIGRGDIGRNSILFPEDWGGAWSREALLYSPKSGYYEGNRNLQDPLLQEIQPRSSEGRTKQKDHLVMMRFHRPLYLIPGMEYLSGEERYILLFHEEIATAKNDFVQKALSDWSGDQDLYRQTLALRLALLKWTSLPIEHQEISLPSALARGSLLVLPEFWEKEKKALIKECSAMGGKKEKEISPRFSSLLKPLIEESLEEGALIRRRGYLQRGDREPLKGLSPFASHCLAKLENTPGGLSTVKVPPPEKNQYELMERMGLLRMTDQWICSEKEYQTNRETLHSLLKTMDEAEIGPLKEASTLSRRELLHTLQWMEEEGEILNQDNRRRLADS